MWEEKWPLVLLKPKKNIIDWSVLKINKVSSIFKISFFLVFPFSVMKGEPLRKLSVNSLKNAMVITRVIKNV